MEAHRKLAENAPGLFPEAERSLKMVKAVQACRQWLPIRRWLVANGVDLKAWPEERNFQAHSEEL